jgi:hypothetical protein
MPKPKNRPRQKSYSRSSDKDRGFVLMRHPFSGIEPQIIREALVGIGAKRAEAFHEMLGRLLDVLRTKYPPHALAILACWGLHAGVSDEGVSEKTLIPYLDQHHVELLQALILTLPSEQWRIEPAAPEDIQNVLDTLTALTEAFYQRRYKLLEREPDTHARAVLALQERLRLHTQVVRNWAFHREVVAISTELYAPLDDKFRKDLGYSASELIALASCMVSTLESRTSERILLLRRIFRSSKISTIVRRYFREYPHVEGDPDAFIRNIPKGTSREAVIVRLLSHADIELPTLVLFKPDELASILGLSTEAVVKMLDDLSLQAGALYGRDVEHLFLDNPVWRFPVIRTGQTYFCPTPQVIFSHIHDIMRSLAESAGLKATLEERRSAYLEKKVANLLRAALPTAQFRHQIKWRVGETDHIAAIDKTILIVEDKSAALSAPGLRGAPERVKRHVRELILDPSDQSARLEAMIWRAKAGNSDASASLSPFGIDFGQTERVVRISVTLDDFSVLASSEREFKEIGWIAADSALAPVLNIADFQYVLEILERPAFLLHYFAERARIQKSIHIAGFELDFLGLYLATGFNIWSIEAEKPELMVTGMSQAVDRYYNNRGAGIAFEKPTPKLHPYFASLIRTMEARAYPGWLGVSIDLLQIASYEEQKELLRLMSVLKTKVQANWRNPVHECSIVLTPPAIRDIVFVFYVFPEALVHRRKEITGQLISKALVESGRARCVLISRCIDRWDDPYSFIIIASQDAEADPVPAGGLAPEAVANT